jgi:PAS domain S-box-containing protein
MGQTYDRTSELAELIAAGVQQFISTNEHTLKQLAERPDIRMMDPLYCDAFLTDVRNLNPLIANVVSVDLSGEVLCSAITQPSGTSTSVAEIEWFKRVVQTDSFVIGEPRMGMISKKWVTPLAYPIHDDQGSLVGVIALSIDLVHWQSVFAGVNLPEGGVISVIDADWTIVARSAAPEQWVGESMWGSSLQQSTASQGTGYLQVKGMDDIERFWTFATVPEVGWRIYVGIPVDVAFSSVQTVISVNVLIGCITVAASCLLAIHFGQRIGRPIRTLSRATDAVMQGQGNTRVTVEGFAEIADVAIRFNSMLSERQRAEEVLRSSELKLRTMFEQAVVGILFLHLDGRPQQINDRFCSLLGYERDELMIMSYWDLTHPDDLLTSHDYYRRLLDGEIQKHTIEQRYIRRDSTVIWVRLTLSLVRFPSGEPMHYLALVEDITYRKQVEQELQETLAELEQRVVERTVQLTEANQQLKREIVEHQATEAALRDSEVRYSAIVNLAPDAIISADEAFQIVLFNQGAEAIFGWRAEDMLGKPIATLLPPRLAGNHQHSMYQMLSKRDTGGNFHTRRHVSAVRHDGEEFPAEVSVSKSRVNGQLRFTIILRDVTERARLENELRNALAKEKELSDLKSRFVTMISHEVRTPLASIRLSNGILRDYSDKLDAQKKQRHFTTIETQVVRLVTLLEDVLSASKVQTVGYTLQARQIDVVALCRAVVEEMSILVAPDHEIVFTTSHNYHEAYLDEKLVRRVLTNLISNAAKYSPMCGQVWMDLQCGLEELVISVQDKGIGIPEEDKTHLFDTFYRASNVGAVEGSGLGLVIVKQAVLAHKGTITVDSEVGLGTCFTIRLPATL